MFTHFVKLSVDKGRGVWSDEREDEVDGMYECFFGEVLAEEYNSGVMLP